MKTSLTTTVDPVIQAGRVLHDEVAAAVAELGDSRNGSTANTHGARKQLKRARATLRLMRDALGVEAYRRDNVALRDAARPLSVVRDSEVLVEVLDGIVRRYGDAASCLPLDKMRRALKKQRSSTTTPRRRLDEIQQELRRVSQRIQRSRFEEVGWPVLSDGFRRVYRRARTALAAAHSEPTTETLHEWRKQTKYLWHQLQVFEPLAPDVLGELADQFHSLSDYLGDEHDLAVLRDQCGTGHNGLDEPSAAALQALIDRRRAELRGKAFALGERLFAEKPKAVTARLDKYWSDWVRESSRGEPAA